MSGFDFESVKAFFENRDTWHLDEEGNGMIVGRPGSPRNDEEVKEYHEAAFKKLKETIEDEVTKPKPLLERVSAVFVDSPVQKLWQSIRVEEFRSSLDEWINEQCGESRQEAADKMIDACKTDSEQLDLQGLQLSSLPSSLWKLSKLKTLTLSHNPLVTLSHDIGHLVNLTRLNLDNCQLVNLPEGIYKLNATINATDNAFSAKRKEAIQQHVNDANKMAKKSLRIDTEKSFLSRIFSFGKDKGSATSTGDAKTMADKIAPGLIYLGTTQAIIDRAQTKEAVESLLRSLLEAKPGQSINSAYGKKMLILHPDKVVGTEEEKMAKIDAYKILTHLKQKYDGLSKS